MSTSTPPEGQPAPMPTPADAQAIFDRAQQAAERAETAAQRLEAGRGAARQEAETRFPGMPPEMVDQIAGKAAETVVAALNAQYELQGRTPPASPASPEAGAGSGPASGTPAASGSAGSEAPAPPAPDQPRNLAHRILGY